MYNSHYLIVGNAGSRKSTFAATFPKPMFVFQMDSYAKAMPYRRLGKPGEQGELVTAEGMEDLGGAIPYENIMSVKHEDRVIARIEHYQTADVSQGVDYIYAYENFLARFPQVYKEVREGKWATIVFDSLSSLSYEARKMDEYKFNPAIQEGKKAHGMQVYGAAARAIEELVRSNLSSLRCNVVLLGHLTAEKGEVGNNVSYWPEAPGKLPRQLPAVFPECYVMHTDEKGECYLQTRSDHEYTATSQIPAPNPCAPTYKALFVDWEKQINEEE